MFPLSVLINAVLYAYQQNAVCLTLYDLWYGQKVNAKLLDIRYKTQDCNTSIPAIVSRRMSRMTRPSKKARLSEPSNGSQDASSEDKHSIFTTWALKRGVEINSVAPQQLPGRGLGLMTTAPIKKGSRLIFIPERAMFKPDNAFIKRSGLSNASPQAKLSLSILAKFNVDDSPLATWQSTWPTKQDFDACLPLSWDRDVLTYLPPAVAAPFERQRADYARDWEAAKALCEQSGWSEEEFVYYWCIVNSRSFHWKPATGGAGSMVLCPFVDYMNHGPTGSGCEVKQSGRGYEVIAERDYGKWRCHFLASFFPLPLRLIRPSMNVLICQQSPSRATTAQCR